MGETLSLWAVFASSFLAATLLPGGSEAVLFAIVRTHPQLYWPALLVATLGNTLGGMTSYLIGRFIPRGPELKGLARVRQHGTPILLLAWLPVVGDAFCVAAGWLRLNAALAAAFMGIGKFSRYLAIAYTAG